MNDGRNEGTTEGTALKVSHPGCFRSRTHALGAADDSADGKRVGPTEGCNVGSVVVGFTVGESVVGASVVGFRVGTSVVGAGVGADVVGERLDGVSVVGLNVVGIPDGFVEGDDDRLCDGTLEGA